MSERHEALRRRLGRVGVWSFALQVHAAAEEQAALRRYDGLGYTAAFIPESIGSKDVFAHAGLLLAGSDRIIVGTGIANIYARDSMAMANGAKALAEAYPGRFVLGIGVSHAPAVAIRGGAYERPIERMTAYLDAMAAATYSGPAPAEAVPTLLAALGPRMLELAGARTDGAHPYFVPVSHTPIARGHLGPEPLLVVEQTAVLDADRTRSRATARAFAARYLQFPNYANNLRRLGYGDDEIANGGSDRLIDDVIVQGDVSAIVARVREHLVAGADHVCVQLRASDGADLCLQAYAELQAGLADLGVGR